MSHPRITLSVTVDLVPGSDIETVHDGRRKIQQLLDHALPHNHPAVGIMTVSPVSRMIKYPTVKWADPISQVPFGD